MASPLLSLFTGRGSRRAVETVIPSRTFADVVLPTDAPSNTQYRWVLA